MHVIIRARVISNCNILLFLHLQASVGFSRQWYGWQEVNWQDIKTKEDTTVHGDNTARNILDKFASQYQAINHIFEILMSHEVQWTVQCYDQLIHLKSINVTARIKTTTSIKVKTFL